MHKAAPIPSAVKVDLIFRLFFLILETNARLVVSHCFGNLRRYFYDTVLGRLVTERVNGNGKCISR